MYAVREKLCLIEMDHYLLPSPQQASSQHHSDTKFLNFLDSGGGLQCMEGAVRGIGWHAHTQQQNRWVCKKLCLVIVLVLKSI